MAWKQKRARSAAERRPTLTASALASVREFGRGERKPAGAVEQKKGLNKKNRKVKRSISVLDPSLPM